MRGIFRTFTSLTLLTTAYASQEQVVFDGYAHQNIKTKNVAIIGMNVSIPSPYTL